MSHVCRFVPSQRLAHNSPPHRMHGTGKCFLERCCKQHTHPGGLFSRVGSYGSRRAADGGSVMCGRDIGPPTFVARNESLVGGVLDLSEPK